jgi:hypothetical protein
VAELCRPSSAFQQAGWSPTADQYYAIGNTRGYDVTGGLLLAAADAQHAADVPPAADASGSIRILLAGCGDVRNLLATAAAMQPPAAGGSSNELGSSSKHVSCRFVLNDGNISMLARDAVMLHMVAALNAPPEAVLAVWANHALSDAHWQLLQHSCKALAEEPWPSWLTASSTLGGTASSTVDHLVQQQQQQSSSANAAVSGGSAGNAAEQEVRAVCASWASCSTSLSELLQMRDILNSSADAFRTAVQLSLSAVSSSSSSSSTSKGSAAVQKEVQSYIKEGSLPAAFSSGSSSNVKQQQQTRANPTFLLGRTLQYTVYFSSSIYRAVKLAPETPGCTSAAQRLLAAVKPQLAAVAAGLRGGWLQVQLVPGEVLAVATAAGSSSSGAAGPVTNVAAVPQLFDYIDTSNVSDYT